jgi:IS605 OrfB family transposase
MLQQQLSLIGIEKEKLNVSEQKEDTKDSYYLTSSENLELQVLKIQNKLKEESVTVESQHPHKKKTWKLKSSSLNSIIQNTKLFQTLDQELILREKDCYPFWTPQSEEISKKLWLPTKTDSVDLVLSSLKESYNPQMGKSWFSIEKKQQQKKSSLTTSFPSLQFSLADCMEKEATLSKKKSEIKSNLKTLKIRLFPTKEEKDQIHLILDQYRWYYNAALNILNLNYSEDKLKNMKSLSSYTLRDLMREYNYREIHWIDGDKTEIEKQFIFDRGKNEIPIPYWWSSVHSRIPRGAVDKLTSSINSAISNYKNKNIKTFKMNYKTKKDDCQYCHFEDLSFPTFIKKIKSHYWFTTKDRKRKTISFNDIFETKKRGLEIIYEQSTDRYYLHYPIEYDWFPKDDKRIENQNMFTSKESRIISLDPGIRKFLVGYDPLGQTVFIGDKASLELTRELLLVDIIEEKQSKLLKWKYIKNLINELHWKVISFLIRNYDTIILPEFNTSEMLRKKKLGKMTKRLMSMFSFYKFKEKLKWKCNIYSKKLVIVNESYTSCTCGVCGEQNNIKGSETFVCHNCNMEIDRDVNGARNILIKNIKI